jgi:hypothetical protein
MPDALKLLELVWRSDLGSDVDVLDLLDWVKLPDGWTQAAAADGDVTVDEVLTFNFTGDDHDELAATLQEIDLKLKQIVLARHPLQPNGVWLRTQLENETGLRQAYLLKAKPGALRVTSPAIWSSKLYQYLLGLTRMPLWESSTEEVLTATVSTQGGKLTYSLHNDNEFIERSRVRRLQVAPVGSISGPQKITELWAGAKGPRYGDTSVFEPVWECADINNYWGEGTTISWIETDTARSGGGYELACTFATVTTLTPRVYFSLADFLPEGDRWGQAGTYQVLLACYVTGTLHARVRCGEGYATAKFNDTPFPPVVTKYLSQFRVGDRQDVTGLTMQLIPLGEFSIPPAMPGSDLTPIDFAALRIEAEAVSGSGSLCMRRLILIPSAEGYLHVSIPSGVVYSTAQQQRLDVYHRPDGRATGSVVSVGDGFINSMAQPDPHDWGLPSGNEESNAVIVFAASSDADPAASMTVNLNTVRRYASLRGAA